MAQRHRPRTSASGIAVRLSATCATARATASRTPRSGSCDSSAGAGERRGVGCTPANAATPLQGCLGSAGSAGARLRLRISLAGRSGGGTRGSPTRSPGHGVERPGTAREPSSPGPDPVPAPARAIPAPGPRDPCPPCAGACEAPPSACASLYRTGPGAPGRQEFRGACPRTRPGRNGRSPQARTPAPVPPRSARRPCRASEDAARARSGSTPRSASRCAGSSSAPRSGHSPDALRVMLASNAVGVQLRVLVAAREMPEPPPPPCPPPAPGDGAAVAGSQPRVCRSSASTKPSVARTASS